VFFYCSLSADFISKCESNLEINNVGLFICNLVIIYLQRYLYLFKQTRSLDSYAGMSHELEFSSMKTETDKMAGSIVQAKYRVP